jgi:DNA polymerase-3 subunit beta
MTTATHITNTALEVGFTINRASLVDALTTAGLAVPKRPDMPVLGGVVLHTRGDHVTISATDYTTSVSVRVAGTVRHPGALVVDHAELTKLLVALVKGTPKRDADRLPVTVRTDDGTPVVDLAGYTMPLTNYVASDYPTVPDAAPTVAHVDRHTFAENMGRVLVAVGTDDVLPMLTGVRLEFTPGQVTMAGTDRYRLAVASLPSVSATQAIPMVPALVPARLLASTVARFTGDRIRIGLDSPTEPSLASLTSADVTVTVQTLDDSFPTYRRLLPDTATGAIQTDRAELLKATRRAGRCTGR